MSWLVRQLFRLWASTWRVHYIGIEAFLDDAVKGVPVGLWHEYLLVVAFVMRHHSQTFIPFVSLSKDGARAATWLEELGYCSIRGSSSKGGGEAFELGVGELRKSRSIAITMDGPRGPRRMAKSGVLRLSKAVDRPYWYIGVEGNGIRLNSWDKMLIPWPFSTVMIHFSSPNAPVSEQPVKAFQAWLDEVSIPRKSS